MKMTESQQKAYELALAGHSLFIRGKAGVGKSFVIDKIKQFQDKENLGYMVVAPTGIAASNVGGATIHSQFGVKVGGVLGFCGYPITDLYPERTKIDAIIIDEVSMLRADVFDQMWINLLMTGYDPMKIQWIFVGDTAQLPPVVTDNDKPVMAKRYTKIDDRYDFRCSLKYQSLGVMEVELDKIMRQSNMEFIDALNELRTTGRIPAYFNRFYTTEPKGVILASTNEEVDKHNQQALEKLPGQYISRFAKYEGEAKAGDCIAPHVLSIKIGCRVMYLKNEQEARDICNGSIGTVGSNEDGLVFLCDNEKRVKITEYKWKIKRYVSCEKTGNLILKEIGSVTQLPITLADSITIHKSQGQTYERATISLKKLSFAPSLAYVAFSRVKDPSGLGILIENKQNR